MPVSAYPDIAIPRGGNTLAHGTLVTSTSAASLVAANTKRVELLISNTDASIDVFVGASGVTADNGVEIKAGTTQKLVTTAQVYAVAASGTPTISYLEVSQG